MTQKGIYKSGSTLWQFGLPNYNLINKQNPDLITIEYGTNDLQLGKRYETPYLFKYNLLLLLNKIQKENRKIILVTTWNRGARSAPYDKVIKEVGQNRNIPVADISSVWKIERTHMVQEGLKHRMGLVIIFIPIIRGIRR